MYMEDFQFPFYIVAFSIYIYIYQPLVGYLNSYMLLLLTSFCKPPPPQKKRLCVFCYHCWELYFCCSAKPGSAKPKEGPTPTDYPTMVPSDRSIGAIKEAPWTLDFFSGWW